MLMKTIQFPQENIVDYIFLINSEIMNAYSFQKVVQLKFIITKIALKFFS